MLARLLVFGPALALGLAAASAGAAPLRLALLPVVVHSGEEDSGYLSDGLAAMLASRLERTGRIAVVRLGDASLATGDERAAVDAARGAGADFVLFGSFTQFGAGASLDLRCAPVSGDAEPAGSASRRIFVQAGALQDVIPQLDELSEKVARYVLGGAPPAAPAEGGPDPWDELRRRVDALERAVYAAPAVGPARPAGPGGAGASPETGSDGESLR